MSKDQETVGEGNPAEIFKNLLDTLQNVKNKEESSEYEEDGSDSSEDEGDDCGSQCDCEDDENSKLKLFNSLLESHRLLCEAFSKLYKD